MIASFGDDATADLYHGRTAHHLRKLPPDVIRRALYKLDMLNAAYRLNDLREPPGNHLEVLKGNLSGYFSIRVSDRWRLVFRWQDNNAHGVSLTDYH